MSNLGLEQRVRQFDKALTAIGNHIQKRDGSLSMAGVDVEEDGIPSSAKSIIDYIESLEKKVNPLENTKPLEMKGAVPRIPNTVEYYPTPPKPPTPPDNRVIKEGGKDSGYFIGFIAGGVVVMISMVVLMILAGGFRL